MTSGLRGWEVGPAHLPLPFLGLNPQSFAHIQGGNGETWWHRVSGITMLEMLSPLSLDFGDWICLRGGDWLGLRQNPSAGRREGQKLCLPPPTHLSGPLLHHFCNFLSTGKKKKPQKPKNKPNNQKLKRAQGSGAEVKLWPLLGPFPCDRLTRSEPRASLSSLCCLSIVLFPHPSPSPSFPHV